MFGTRRLAKRSIVGTRVCAAFCEDGLYFPGTIESTSEWPNGSEVYNIQFDHCKTTKTYKDTEIIGPGFQAINVAHLKKGQQVFVTHNSRETSGTVVAHDPATGDVTINVEINSRGKTEVVRKIEEIRLLISRRSARLQDHQNTNYSHIADVPSDSRRRTVSHSIDVPVTNQFRRQRRANSFSADGLEREIEDSLMDADESMTMDQNPDVMDETMAAMVLTSFSCSPMSPGQAFPLNFREKDETSPGTPSSSVGSSGVWGSGNKCSPQFSSYSNRSSLQQCLSSSAPVNGCVDTLFGSYPIDEGIEVDDSDTFFAEELNGVSRKRRLSTRTVFKCLWPNCGKFYNTGNGIEKHVRYDHLGPKQPDPVCASDSDDLSDHEEEFYYTEVEVSVDTVTQTFADMHTSSPPASLPKQSLPDHDYQKKSLPLNIPPSSTDRAGSLPGSLSVSAPKVSRSFSWQNAPTKMSKLSPVRSYASGTPPKTSPMHKKSRSDTKKCRKYYGMENRELWCTQCKWKKACTRFLDYYSHASKIRTHENKGGATVTQGSVG